MTSSSFISTEWNKQKRIFLNNLDTLKKELNTDAVHDIRVAIKTMRACVDLFVKISNKKEAEELFKDTEDLFTVLGKQRDIEICQKHIISYEKKNKIECVEFKIHLGSSLERASNWCKNALKKYSRNNLSHTG